MIAGDRQGVKGNAGVDGVKGDQGIQGVKGNTGVDGVKGDQGIQGVKGNTGVDGVKGDQGIQGNNGDSTDFSDINAVSGPIEKSDLNSGVSKYRGSVKTYTLKSGTSILAGQPVCLDMAANGAITCKPCDSSTIAETI